MVLQGKQMHFEVLSVYFEVLSVVFRGLSQQKWLRAEGNAEVFSVIG